MTQGRMTLKEYEAYLKLPTWAKDSADFKSKADYDAYWSREIQAWKKQYDDAFGEVVDDWKFARAYVEANPSRGGDVFKPESKIAASAIPYAEACLTQQVAMLFTNAPQPTYISPTKEQDQYANAANETAKIELRANSFNSMGFDMGADLAYTNMAVLKTMVDWDQRGAFGQEGRIVIDRIDPEKMAVDPTAKKLEWSKMAWLIHSDDYDLGTARQMFPGGAQYLGENFTNKTTDQDKDGMFGFNQVSPVGNPFDDSGKAKARNTIKIRECWLKDERLKFQAHEHTVINTEFLVDDNGDQYANEDYDPELPEVYAAPIVDDDGFVQGEWVPAYPDGRCIVTAGDSVVITDIANPFWSKEAPFTFFRAKPSGKLICRGDVTNIAIVDAKINDVKRRIHIMAQGETERPMLAETNTFKTPRGWFKMSGQSTSVIVKNPGREFMRMPPTEVPAFLWLYLGELKQDLDMVCYVAGVLRGQVQEGQQVSAEGMQSMQGMATVVLRMKSMMIGEGMKTLGRQMLWLMRQTYPQDIKTVVTMPDGKPIEVEWSAQDYAIDYLVEVAPGSGLPGAEQAQEAKLIPLYREGAIDQIALLQGLNIHDWQAIVERMTKDRLAKIEAEAAGKALGMDIKKFNKEKTDGKAGRIAKA